MKKILSVILCICMLMCPLAVTSLAADGECEHDYSVTFVAPTCADKGYTMYTCGKCGDIKYDNYIAPLGHSYGNWDTIKEVTCTEEGVLRRGCVRCNSFETKTVPVLQHVDANKDGKCDECTGEVEVEVIFSPYDWLKAFFAAVKAWFAAIFA